MAKVIVASIEQNPAPRRIALASDAIGAIQKALTDRLTALEGQREVAFSTDFPRSFAARDNWEVMMKILLFGANGMVGDGVLRWLIASPQVSRVVAVSRKPFSIEHPKLEIFVETDMFHLQLWMPFETSTRASSASVEARPA